MESTRLARLIRGFLAACAVVLSSAQAAADVRDFERIRSSGTLRIGVYTDFAPFSDRGNGIDVDVARAIAARLGLAADVRAYDAGENMEDDLRNIVLQGRAFGVGPEASDAMLHVPVDEAFKQRNPRVRIVAPYYRETLAVIRSTAMLPKLDASIDLDGQPIAAESDSLLSHALLTADGGRLRDQVRHFHDLADSLGDLAQGRLAAVFGTRSQIEPLKARSGAGYAMGLPPPLPNLPQAGWALGLAVRADQAALAGELEKAVAALSASGELDAIFRKHGVTRQMP